MRNTTPQKRPGAQPRIPSPSPAASADLSAQVMAWAVSETALHRDQGYKVAVALMVTDVAPGKLQPGWNFVITAPQDRYAVRSCSLASPSEAMVRALVHEAISSLESKEVALRDPDS